MLIQFHSKTSKTFRYNKKYVKKHLNGSTTASGWTGVIVNVIVNVVLFALTVQNFVQEIDFSFEQDNIDRGRVHLRLEGGQLVPIDITDVGLLLLVLGARQQLEDLYLSRSKLVHGQARVEVWQTFVVRENGEFEIEKSFANLVTVETIFEKNSGQGRRGFPPIFFRGAKVEHFPFVLDEHLWSVRIHGGDEKLRRAPFLPLQLVLPGVETPLKPTWLATESPDHLLLCHVWLCRIFDEVLQRVEVDLWHVEELFWRWRNDELLGQGLDAVRNVFDGLEHVFVFAERFETAVGDGLNFVAKLLQKLICFIKRRNIWF